MPDPGPAQAVELETLWQAQVNSLSAGANSKAALAAAEALSAAIDNTRQAEGEIQVRLE